MHTDCFLEGLLVVLPLTKACNRTVGNWLLPLFGCVMHTGKKNYLKQNKNLSVCYLNVPRKLLVSVKTKSSSTVNTRSGEHCQNEHHSLQIFQLLWAAWGSSTVFHPCRDILTHYVLKGCTFLLFVIMQGLVVLSFCECNYLNNSQEPRRQLSVPQAGGSWFLIASSFPKTTKQWLCSDGAALRCVAGGLFDFQSTSGSWE